MNYPCPCCGHLVFDEMPGTHVRCPICGWEDDMAQLRFPAMPGSANTVSLESAQRNYVAYGASQRNRLAQVRSRERDDVRDPDWRPLDRRRDNVEEPQRGSSYANSYPLEDTTVLYYWRAGYWRRLSG